MNTGSEQKELETNFSDSGSYSLVHRVKLSTNLDQCDDLGNLQLIVLYFQVSFIDFSSSLGTHSIMQCDTSSDCPDAFLRLNMEPWREAEALKFLSI